MKITKQKRNNIIFLIVIALFFIPQARQPIQVFLQKGFALISPSIETDKNQKKLVDYNWKLKDESGTVFNFEAHKGKVVLINFWATWCPPCIAEMPSMQKLYNDYKDKVDFVFITTDYYSEINPFLKKNNYTFKVVRPQEAYPEFFNIISIPRTFLIDKEGNIIIDKNGAANWNSDLVRDTIDHLLN
ncbi:TlpA family protein disulfide reductase [Thalassobellus suaedae]|uniref:Redoxin family protein n=1 Tax=Thalassobellus suaedae TaxID=3074124 RepID=A0ABY9XP67_9FLAO|nr:redoxin family protein [Flavobacteriaceae bacterium HL-DH14]WNH12874.1 redoxin family protein [Flavobacteriaceae bacterium HL-DH10]